MASRERAHSVGHARTRPILGVPDKAFAFDARHTQLSIRLSQRCDV